MKLSAVVRLVAVDFGYSYQIQIFSAAFEYIWATNHIPNEGSSYEKSKLNLMKTRCLSYLVSYLLSVFYILGKTIAGA